MKWKFQLDDRNGLVHLVSDFITDDGMPYDLHEEVYAGGNFCDVKYAAMHAAKQGVLEVSWERFAKWRAR